jgi:acetylornithine deacetylase/succinyl-diaminopimelate desuccinylase-like protein
MSQRPSRSRDWILRVLIVAVILGSAVVGSIRYRALRAEAYDPEGQLYIPKKEVITPEIRLLQEYLRIDTSNPPGNELAGARFLADRLKAAGVEAEVIESAPGRGNVYARLRGRGKGEGLLLLHHIDVVPADGKGWTRPPFAGKTKQNQLYGRGALDMKGIGICHLLGFLEAVKAGRPPEHDVVFLGVADEEEGGRFGVEWLLAHRPDVFAGVRYALNEGGITEMAKERITYFGIETGSKQTIWTRLHGTRKELRRARLALEPFFTPQVPERVLPEVKRFLAAIAPNRLQHRQRIADVDRTIESGKFWLLPLGLRELFYNNLWAAGAEGSDDEAVMDVSLFDLPDESPDARLAWFKSLMKPYAVRVEVRLKMGPSPISPETTPVFALLADEVRKEYGPIRVGPEILAFGATDSRFLRPRGIVCYGFWPYPVDFFQTQGIHGIDERVRLDWFMQGVELMRRLVPRYAGVSE